MSDFNLAHQIASAFVAIALRGQDEYGRPYPISRRREFLAEAARTDPSTISAAIRRLESQLALLRPYLEPPHEAP